MPTRGLNGCANCDRCSRRPDPCQRTQYRPGELAQFDPWQPDALIPVGFGRFEMMLNDASVTLANIKAAAEAEHGFAASSHT